MPENITAPQNSVESLQQLEAKGDEALNAELSKEFNEQTQTPADGTTADQNTATPDAQKNNDGAEKSDPSAPSQDGAQTESQTKTDDKGDGATTTEKPKGRFESLLKERNEARQEAAAAKQTSTALEQTVKDLQKTVDELAQKSTSPTGVSERPDDRARVPKHGEHVA